MGLMSLILGKLDKNLVFRHGLLNHRHLQSAFSVVEPLVFLFAISLLLSTGIILGFS